MKENTTILWRYKMNVYEKLMNIQNELVAPKNQYNAFGKYKYRSCEDILESLKPLLAKYKATLIISDDISHVEGRHYVVARVVFMDIEKGEQITNTAFAREEENKKGMDGSQITGSASSYARKYALNGMFCIDDTKDSDSTNTHGKDKKTDTKQPSTPNAKQTAKPKKITGTQAKTLSQLIEMKGVDIKKILAYFKVEKIEDLMTDQYGKTMEQLKAK